MLNKALVISYLAGQIVDQDRDLMVDSVKSILDTIIISDDAFTVNEENEVFKGIIGLIKDTLEASAGTSYNADRVLSELKLICGKLYSDIYMSIYEGFPKDSDNAGEKRQRLLQEINSASRIKRERDIRSLISAANVQVTVNPDNIDTLDEFVDSLIDKLTATQLNTGQKDKAVINDIRFDDTDGQMEEVFEKYIDEEEGKSSWILPWKALGDAFQGFWKSGDTVLIGAMQHNYKTSFTLSLFKGLAVFNKANDFRTDPSLEPCISRISFEDNMVNNLSFLALNILWNKNFKEGSNKPSDISNLNSNDMTTLVIDELTQNGWKIHMARVNGDEWSYKDVIKKTLTLASEGYDVKAQILDYLFMVSKAGLEFNSMGSDVRNLLRKMRNFYGAKEILGITPSQLSPAVKKLISEGVVAKNDLLEYICDLGMFSESSKLPEEPEIVFYLNKVKTSEAEFLHILVEKHRTSKVLINASLKSFYLRFPDNGMCIPDDPDGEAGITLYRLPRDTNAFF